MTQRIVLIALSFLLLVSQALAERQNSLSAQIGATASLDNNPRVTIGGGGSVTGGEISPVYALFPTLSVDSTGANSLFQFNYSFGYQYVRESRVKDFYHHAFGTALTTQAGRNLGISIRQHFIKAQEFTTTDLFRGIVFTPEGAFFDYETLVVDRDGFANTVTADFDYRISDRSALEFGVGHSMRRY